MNQKEITYEETTTTQSLCAAPDLRSPAFRIAGDAFSGTRRPDDGVQFEEVSDTQITAKLEQEDALQAEDAENAIDPQEDVRIFIVFEEAPALKAGFSAKDIGSNQKAKAYAGRLLRAQEQMIGQIEQTALAGETLAVRHHFTLAANAISATVAYGKLDEIAQVDGVAGVYLAPVYEVCTETTEPNTITAGSMIGSYNTWVDGYTGAGMRIGVIDTGLDTDHPAFSEGGFLLSLEETAAAQNTTVDAYDLLDAAEIQSVLQYLNASASLSGVTAGQLYLNAKVPFAFNYIDEDLDVTHDNDAQGDHGTHVSGIAAANLYTDKSGGTDYVNMHEADDVTGVAPDAQLLCAKVFGKNGGAYSDDYIAAIQDFLYLNVDVINLSLGSSAGFSCSYDGTDFVNQVFDSLSSTDVVVTVSAGNAYSSAYSNSTGLDLNRTADVDISIAGSPGTYTNAFTVASAVNTGITSHYFSVGDQPYTYTDTATVPLYTLAGSSAARTLEYVFLGDPTQEGDTVKYGAADAYTSAVREAVRGKIVFVSRGVSSFADKQAAAADAGAVAMIVYNNVSGSINMALNEDSTLPAVSITKDDGEKILGQSVKDDATGFYGGTIYIHSDVGTIENVGSGMSDFSSWGRLRHFGTEAGNHSPRRQHLLHTE